MSFLLIILTANQWRMSRISFFYRYPNLDPLAEFTLYVKRSYTHLYECRAIRSSQDVVHRPSLILVWAELVEHVGSDWVLEMYIYTPSSVFVYYMCLDAQELGIMLVICKQYVCSAQRASHKKHTQDCMHARTLVACVRRLHSCHHAYKLCAWENGVLLRKLGSKKTQMFMGNL